MKSPAAATLDDEMDLVLFLDLAHQIPPSMRLQLLVEYVAELANDPEQFQRFQDGVEHRLLQAT